MIGRWFLSIEPGIIVINKDFSLKNLKTWWYVGALQQNLLKNV